MQLKVLVIGATGSQTVKQLEVLQLKWCQFEPEVILLAVGWYLRFSLSYRDVIGVQTSLGEQLLDVPVRQGKTQIPTNRQKDDFRFELPPLEQTGNR